MPNTELRRESKTSGVPHDKKNECAPRRKTAVEVHKDSAFVQPHYKELLRAHCFFPKQRPGTNPQLCTEYAEDILQYLRNIEVLSWPFFYLEKRLATCLSFIPARLPAWSKIHGGHRACYQHHEGRHGGLVGGCAHQLQAGDGHAVPYCLHNGQVSSCK